jgi:thioredoxin-related protein
MRRKLVLSFILASLLLFVLTIFWQQEIKYLTATTIPPAYSPVAVKQTIDLHELGETDQKKPVLLHFFNPNCPCSRFNTDHFVSLVKEYGQEVSFYVVIQFSQDKQIVEEVLSSYGLGLPVIIDENEALAQKCGVYSTPQAVLLDNNQQLFYRGNYNRSRYCTDRQTSYAHLALDALRAGTAPPNLSALATIAYGCELKDNNTSFLNFLNF